MGLGQLQLALSPEGEYSHNLGAIWTVMQRTDKTDKALWGG